ncbi:Transcriptional activator somA [Fusarium oxysporum f. sp. rapae]|uniref:Transcriptional activator somA n=1 Tax=Fusarium oxysporum f. sp. rapae TaxID=485398 RepID=A0A8J5NMF8_FUSOX|nr:Transcriptional activator somA [Fusarium oxysporum f. sp. rapae]
MANMKAKTGHPHDASRHFQENYNKRTQLNTYIYEYFLHNRMFQCAQSILKADSDVKVQRHSPSNDRHDKGLRLKNAPRNKTIDSRLDSTHSNLLPASNIPNLSPDSCFLYEWFGLFWAMFNAQKNEDGRIEAYQYACHIQQPNWRKWNVSWPQTQSSSLLLQAPGSTTHNAFFNSDKMDSSKTRMRSQRDDAEAVYIEIMEYLIARAVKSL